MYQKRDHVFAQAFTKFPHNYNQVSRELMYAWANRHFQLGLSDTRERPFVSIEPSDLRVFNEQYPTPAKRATDQEIAQYWNKTTAETLLANEFSDPESSRKVVDILKPALEAMVVDRMPRRDEVQVLSNRPGEQRDEYTLARLESRAYFPSEEVPCVLLKPTQWSGRVVVWSDATGGTNLSRQHESYGRTVQSLLDRGIAVLGVDVLGTGKHNPDNTPTSNKLNMRAKAFTYAYNRSLLANQVHDMLTAITFVRHLPGVTQVDLLGVGQAGVWTVLAKGLAGDAVTQTAADLNGFSFNSVKTYEDPMLLPGALKYGDLIGLASLCAPDSVLLGGVDPAVHGEKPAKDAQGNKLFGVTQLQSLYRAVGRSDRLQLSPKRGSDFVTEASAWLK